MELGLEVLELLGLSFVIYRLTRTPKPLDLKQVLAEAVKARTGEMSGRERLQARLAQKQADKA